ncbi:MAG: hypothetical protein KUL82_08780 [Bdellovibrio sp.]|uniref:hypothetical protein n=1 Tax=Bdellovibrio sp. TaxID=28201 RepID=UPI0039E589B3|nr:hypothetical protein [Bdellovibrio sp.]
MDKDMIQGKLTELSGALKQNFGNLNLSEDELKKAMTSPDEFVSLVSQKTGLPKEETSKKVHQVMDTLHIDDAMAKGFMAKIGDKVESKFEQIKNKFSH